MLKVKVTGLDKVKRELEGLARRARGAHGNHSVPVSELLTPTFIRRNTRFANADELFKASGFSIESSDDFRKIPDDKWDAYIRSVSSFSSWESMLSKAGEAWITRKLGL